MSESRTFWGTERTTPDEHEDGDRAPDGQPIADAEQPASDDGQPIADAEQPVADERLTTEDLAGVRAEESVDGQPVEDGFGDPGARETGTTDDGTTVTDAVIAEPVVVERGTIDDETADQATPDGETTDRAAEGHTSDGAPLDGAPLDGAPLDGAPLDGAPLAAPADGIDLLDDETITAMRSRWQDVQADFVDEPRRAVQDADSLVAELMQRLAQAFAAERQQLELQWSRGDEVSTEDLRLTLRHYRSFFQRLLAF